MLHVYDVGGIAAAPYTCHRREWPIGMLLVSADFVCAVRSCCPDTRAAAWGEPRALVERARVLSRAEAPPHCQQISVTSTRMCRTLLAEIRSYGQSASRTTLSMAWFSARTTATTETNRARPSRSAPRRFHHVAVAISTASTCCAPGCEAIGVASPGQTGHQDGADGRAVH